MANIWPTTRDILRKKEAGLIEGLLVVAVNDVFNSHRLRISAVFDSLPRVVLVMLVFIATASLAVAGFNAGISVRMSRSRMTALALVLAGVMLLIVEFDRPISGFIRVSQDSIRAEIAEMERNLAH